MRFESVKSIADVRVGDVLYRRVVVLDVSPPRGDYFGGFVETDYRNDCLKAKDLGDVLRLVPEGATFEVDPCNGDCLNSSTCGICDDHLEAVQRSLAIEPHESTPGAWDYMDEVVEAAGVKP